MLWVVLLGFMTSSLLSILANHNQTSKIWLDRLKNIIQSIVINSHWEPPLTNAPRLGWVIGRGEPGGGKEGKVRRQSVPSLRGGGSERQTRCLVSVFTKRGIKRMKNRSIYTKFTNICTTSSPADPQMRRNLNARAQGAFVRYGAQWE